MKHNVAFLSISLFGALLYSMSWSISFYSQVLFQSAGLSNKLIGTLNGAETWVSAAIAGGAFWGERRLGKRGSILVSGIGFGGSLILFALHRSPGQTIAAFFMMAVFISYLEPLLEAYLNELLPSSIRATMLSVFSMMVSTGMMLTFSCIGMAADRIGLPAALKYWLILWVPLCAAGMWWSLRYAGKGNENK